MSLPNPARAFVVAPAGRIEGIVARLTVAFDEGLDILSFESLEGVAEALAHSPPDVILCDVDPDTGLDLAQLDVLRTGDRPAPLVAVTRRSTPSRLMDLLAAGVAEVALWDEIDAGALVDLARRAMARGGVRGRSLDESDRYRELVEKIREGIYESDLEGSLTFVNPALARILGFDAPDKLLGKRFFEFVSETDLPRVVRRYTDAMASGVASQELRVRAVRMDGAPMVLEIRPGPLVSEGRVVGSRGTVRDVTVEADTVDALSRSQRMLRLVLDSIPVGVFWKDTDSRYEGINRFLADLAGIEDPRDVRGRRDEDLVWGVRAEEYRNSDRKVLKGGEALPPFRGLLRTADDRDVEVETEKIPLLDSEGSVIGVMGVLRDITHQVESERELRLMSRILEEAKVMVLVTDTVGSIRYVNPFWTEVTGYALDEVRGETPRILNSGKTQQSVHAGLWATLLRGDTWRGSLVNRAKDGREFVEDKIITPVKDARGTPEYFVSIGTDITEALRIEERLSRAQRVEAITRLTGGIAHDFNNLLSVVMANTSLAIETLGEGADKSVVGDLSDAVRAAESGRDMVKALMAYSLRAQIAPEALNLGAVVERMLPLLQRGTRDDVEIFVGVDADVPKALADATALSQMLLSLVANAQDAMPDGGRVDVAVEMLNVDEAFLSAHPWCRAGRYATVRVTDTGGGMDDETLDRVFDPFFTTKNPERGTGMGLAMTYGLMIQHQGFTLVETEVGVGTSVTLMFPTAD